MITWKKIWSLPLILVLVITVLDQWTKTQIATSQYLRFGGKIEIIPEIFNIVYVTNTGAAWGMFSRQATLLAVISGIVFIVLVLWFRKFTDNFTERCVAVSLMLGGIAGNFIDRVSYGAVIDFLSFTYRSFEWPAFNVADSAICVGVTILAISTLVRPETKLDAAR